MEHDDLLRYLAVTLEKLGLQYAVTGSTATTTYGEPRFTNDIDVVVALSAAQIPALLNAFPEEDYYFNRATAENAVARRHQFNIIHTVSGLKIDVIVASDSEFDRNRLLRVRHLSVLPDRTVAFAAPEDVILKKLQYFREGGSEKHLRDIAGVLSIQGDAVDRNYIESWARRLNVSEQWGLVLSRMTEPSAS